MADIVPDEGQNLADRLLTEWRESRRPVSIYLVSGFQLKGEIVEFDGGTILFKLKDAHQLVMRSAVASMYPLPESKGQADDWWRPYAPGPQ